MTWETRRGPLDGVAYPRRMGRVGKCVICVIELNDRQWVSEWIIIGRGRFGPNGWSAIYGGRLCRQMVWLAKGHFGFVFWITSCTRNCTLYIAFPFHLNPFSTIVRGCRVDGFKWKLNIQIPGMNEYSIFNDIIISQSVSTDPYPADETFFGWMISRLL